MISSNEFALLLSKAGERATEAGHRLHEFSAAVSKVRVSRQYFYAVFADGREQRVSIAVLNGESMSETLSRTATELGAIKVVLKPEEAKVKVE